VVFFFFILPNYINKYSFFKYISSIGALLVIIALPAHIFDDYSLLWITVDTFNSSTESILGTHKLMNSIIDGSPNRLAYILFVSVIGALYIADEHSKNEGVILLIVNSVGLVLTVSRASIGVTLLSIILYYLYKNFPQQNWIITSGLLVTYSILFLYIFNILPISDLSSLVGFSTRRTIWNSILLAVQEKNLLGWGLYDESGIIQNYHPQGLSYTAHNAYLSFYLSNGLFGLFLYLFLIIYTLLRYCFNNEEPIMISIIFGFLIWKFVEGDWMVGNEPDAVLLLILLGLSMKRTSSVLSIR
jgi:O-antigen ligase